MPRLSGTSSQGAQRINPWKRFHGIFLPLWLLERTELTLAAKVLYAVLARAAGKHGFCWPSQRWLGKQLGVKERQLRKYLYELTSTRLVEIRQRGRKHGGVGQSATYWFFKHRWMTDSEKIARQSSAGQNALPGTRSAGRNSDPLKTRARGLKRVNKTEENQRTRATPRAAAANVNGRSHAIEKAGKPDIGDGTVRGLVSRLAGKFRAGVPSLSGPVDETE